MTTSFGRVLVSCIAFSVFLRVGSVAEGADRLARPDLLISPDRGFGAPIAFSPSGTRLVVLGASAVSILDAESGDLVLSHKQPLSAGPFSINSAALSPDGKLVASPERGGTIELWDATSGDTIRRLEAQGTTVPAGKDERFPMASIVVGFSSDGSRLAVQTPDGNLLTLFDVATGKPALSLHLVGTEGLAMPSSRFAAAFAPGREVLATAFYSNKLSLWDLKTGKLSRELAGHQGTISAISISPDSRLVASCAGDWSLKISRFIDSEDHTVRLWDMPTGRLVATMKGHTDNVRSVVFCPDARTLLSAGEDNTVRLWETSSGKQLCYWHMGQRVNQVAVSPNGKKFAAALFNGAIALFPLELPPRKSQTPADANGFERMWDQLGCADAERAYAVVRDLSGAGAQVPVEMRKRLRPIPIALPAEVHRLVADLDAADFDRREAASKALAALGPQAEPALRKALDETTSAEVRSRIQPLLKALDQWVVTDPDTLRALRAIWVLERIGTPEARAVLEDLAKGAPEARQTQEAKNALDFLDKRAAAAKEAP